MFEPGGFEESLVALAGGAEEFPGELGGGEKAPLAVVLGVGGRGRGGRDVERGFPCERGEEGSEEAVGGRNGSGGGALWAVRVEGDDGDHLVAGGRAALAAGNREVFAAGGFGRRVERRGLVVVYGGHTLSGLGLGLVVFCFFLLNLRKRSLISLV